MVSERSIISPEDPVVFKRVALSLFIMASRRVRTGLALRLLDVVCHFISCLEALMFFNLPGRDRSDWSDCHIPCGLAHIAGKIFQSCILL